MKVLITGGTGTISSGLVQASVNMGYETYALTRGNNKDRNIAGAKYLYADIANREQVQNVIDGLLFDVVVECLAYGIEQLKSSLDMFANKNVQYFFVSTAAIYKQKCGRIKETDELDLDGWDYSKKKIQCEKYLEEYAQEKGIKFTIIRPTVTYGDYRIPFPIATRMPGWTFFERIKSGQLMLAGDNVKFSVIHIDDFSVAVVRLFGNSKAINKAFHITSNSNDIYWDDVVDEAAKHFEVDSAIIHVPEEIYKRIWPSIYSELKFHKNVEQIFDDSRLKEAVGEFDTIDIQEGLGKTILAMEKEVTSSEMRLDEKWSDYCNATIYYAYLKGALSLQETEKVKKYMEEHGEETLKESYKKVIAYNKKIMLRSIKTKLKNGIKRILRK